MKYKQKIEEEIEIEFEAGDIIEWTEGTEKILAVVTEIRRMFIAGMAFYDNRDLGVANKVPHNIVFDPVNHLDKLRKVPKEEWKSW